MDQILEVVIGSRESIRRGGAVGIVSSFFMIAFLVTYFLFFPFDQILDDLPSFRDLNPGVWIVIICIILVLLLVGGYSIGWLMIRPAASVWRAIAPDFTSKVHWTFSTICVWSVISLSILFPYGKSIAHQILVVIIDLAWVALAGVVSGRAGAAVNTEIISNESREFIFIGAIVTGGLICAYLTIVNVVVNLEFTPPDIIGFYLSLSIIPLLAVVPYTIISPIGIGLSKLPFLSKRPHVVFVLCSGTIWTLIGYFFHLAVAEDPIRLKNYFDMLIFGLFGICGGCAMELFRVDVGDQP